MQIRKQTWYNAKVLVGDKIGRTIGFPTINLDPTIFPHKNKQGVYAALVKYDNKEYKAAFFFGPRKVRSESAIVLEIYILDYISYIANMRLNIFY
mgnify:CR=1 FL=1